MSNLVAINIILEDKLVNTNGIPVLFYWDGKTDIKEQMKESEKFNAFLNKNNILNNSKNFINTRLCYFLFSDNDNTANNNELYEENTVFIQDLFPFENIKLSITKEVLNYLYNCSFGRNYDKEIADINILVKNIYNEIKEKYQEKLCEGTFINAIRSYIDEHYDKLNAKYKENIIDEISNNLL